MNTKKKIKNKNKKDTKYTLEITTYFPKGGIKFNR